MERCEDDAALLEAVVAGDMEALATLMRRHQAPLYRAALQVVHEPSDAEDVVQDVFLRVYRGKAGFRGQGSVRAWLYRIAVNLAIDVVRSRSRETVIGPIERADGGARTDPLDAAIDRERAGAVRAAVDALPRHYRLPLILREWHDLSYEEIASVLRVPVGTVRSRLHAGREILRRRLADLVRDRGDRR